jgi:hypothetical protein
MGLLDSLLRPFKSAERSIEAQTVGKAKNKARRMQSMPKSRMNQGINKATGSLNKEIRKATKPPKF